MEIYCYFDCGDGLYSVYVLLSMGGGESMHLHMEAPNKYDEK